MNFKLLRKLLFRISPETAHQGVVLGLKMMQKYNFRSTQIENKRLESDYWGLTFRNPVGLAAGFDKDASVYPALAGLGFGFVEVGTLTPLPQGGNPKPRLFRFPQDQSIINRMGFNNHGVIQAEKQFKKLLRPSIPIGINIGKNKDTPNHQAADDYCIGLETLYAYADYFVINISSPNTIGLRDLQDVHTFQGLLTTILTKAKRLAREHKRKCPILIKVSPDLEEEHLVDLINIALQLGIDGIIATNTTLSREGLGMAIQEAGGLSGRPLSQIATSMIGRIYNITQNRIPIIGVGGIFTGEDAYEKIRAGANLLQVYTGFVYRGPHVARYINEELLQLLDRDGISTIADAVGLDLKKQEIY